MSTATSCGALGDGGNPPPMSEEAMPRNTDGGVPPAVRQGSALQHQPPEGYSCRGHLRRGQRKAHDGEELHAGFEAIGKPDREVCGAEMVDHRLECKRFPQGIYAAHQDRKGLVEPWGPLNFAPVMRWLTILGCGAIHGTSLLHW
jgi:hypothetical protein